MQTFLTKQEPADAKLVMGGLRSSNSSKGAGGKGAGGKKGPLGEMVGDRLEVSGECMLVVKDVAERVAKDR